MRDMIANGMDWLRGKQEEFVSRSVTYSGVRDGDLISEALTVQLGTSQLTQINSLGMEQGAGDFSLANPEEVDRDFIVNVATMRDLGLWPPRSGDIVDDEVDISGVTNRYRVMSIPGQSPWRYLRGSYTKQARIHTKFFAEITELWSDAFTGSDGAALIGHAPDLPAGGSYSGGAGSVLITSNRVRANASVSYTYFNHGGSDGTETRVEFCANGITQADITNRVAEVGVGIRCATSGAGLRNGYYCKLQFTYSGGANLAYVYIFENSTGKAYGGPVVNFDLSTVYHIVVRDDLDGITLTLMDETGEVSLASVRYATTTYNTNTGAAVYFNYDAAIAGYATPYLDDLTVVVKA